MYLALEYPHKASELMLHRGEVSVSQGYSFRKSEYVDLY